MSGGGGGAAASVVDSTARNPYHSKPRKSEDLTEDDMRRREEALAEEARTRAQRESRLAGQDEVETQAALRAVQELERQYKERERLEKRRQERIAKGLPEEEEEEAPAHQQEETTTGGADEGEPQGLGRDREAPPAPALAPAPAEQVVVHLADPYAAAPPTATVATGYSSFGAARGTDVAGNGSGGHPHVSSAGPAGLPAQVTASPRLGGSDPYSQAMPPGAAAPVAVAAATADPYTMMAAQRQMEREAEARQRKAEEPRQGCNAGAAEAGRPLEGAGWEEGGAAVDGHAPRDVTPHRGTGRIYDHHTGKMMAVVPKPDQKEKEALRMSREKEKEEQQAAAAAAKKERESKARREQQERRERKAQAKAEKKAAEPAAIKVMKAQAELAAHEARQANAKREQDALAKKRARAQESASRGPRSGGVLYKYSSSGSDAIVNAAVAEGEPDPEQDLWDRAGEPERKKVGAGLHGHRRDERPGAGSQRAAATDGAAGRAAAAPASAPAAAVTVSAEEAAEAERLEREKLREVRKERKKQKRAEEVEALNDFQAAVAAFDDDGAAAPLPVGVVLIDEQVGIETVSAGDEEFEVVRSKKQILKEKKEQRELEERQAARARAKEAAEARREALKAEREAAKKLREASRKKGKERSAAKKAAESSGKAVEKAKGKGQVGEAEAGVMGPGQAEEKVDSAPPPPTTNAWMAPGGLGRLGSRSLSPVAVAVGADMSAVPGAGGGLGQLGPVVGSIGPATADEEKASPARKKALQGHVIIPQHPVNLSPSTSPVPAAARPSSAPSGTPARSSGSHKHSAATSPAEAVLPPPLDLLPAQHGLLDSPSLAGSVPVVQMPSAAGGWILPVGAAPHAAASASSAVSATAAAATGPAEWSGGAYGTSQVAAAAASQAHHQQALHGWTNVLYEADGGHNNPSHMAWGMVPVAATQHQHQHHGVQQQQQQHTQQQVDSANSGKRLGSSLSPGQGQTAAGLSGFVGATSPFGGLALGGYGSAPLMQNTWGVAFNQGVGTQGFYRPLSSAAPTSPAGAAAAVTGSAGVDLQQWEPEASAVVASSSEKSAAGLNTAAIAFKPSFPAPAQESSGSQGQCQGQGGQGWSAVGQEVTAAVAAPAPAAVPGKRRVQGRGVKGHGQGQEQGPPAGKADGAGPVRQQSGSGGDKPGGQSRSNKAKGRSGGRGRGRGGGRGKARPPMPAS
ncbi:unnamed protein product [Chrysoparadoxa australica]